MEFCAWLSEKTGLTVRLPTEIEWEYVARGPSGSSAGPIVTAADGASWCGAKALSRPESPSGAWKSLMKRLIRNRATGGATRYLPWEIRIPGHTNAAARRPTRGGSDGENSINAEPATRRWKTESSRSDSLGFRPVVLIPPWVLDPSVPKPAPPPVLIARADPLPGRPSASSGTRSPAAATARSSTPSVARKTAEPAARVTTGPKPAGTAAAMPPTRRPTVSSAGDSSSRPRPTEPSTRTRVAGVPESPAPSSRASRPPPREVSRMPVGLPVHPCLLNYVPPGWRYEAYPNTPIVYMLIAPDEHRSSCRDPSTSAENSMSFTPPRRLMAFLGPRLPR